MRVATTRFREKPLLCPTLFTLLSYGTVLTNPASNVSRKITRTFSAMRKEFRKHFFSGLASYQTTAPMSAEWLSYYQSHFDR